MTTRQISEAVKIAQSDRDLSDVDDSTLHGCALPEFKPVYVTVDMVAKLIRWQCVGLFNSDFLDAQELDNIAHIARRKFFIL